MTKSWAEEHMRGAQALRTSKEAGASLDVSAQAQQAPSKGARSSAGLNTQAWSFTHHDPRSGVLARRRPARGRNTREGQRISGSWSNERPRRRQLQLRRKRLRRRKARSRRGGSHGRDSRHGSADLERWKVPAVSRAGETVQGGRNGDRSGGEWGRVEAQNADGEQ